jgi:hypothetical protein
VKPKTQKFPLLLGHEIDVTRALKETPESIECPQFPCLLSEPSVSSGYILTDVSRELLNPQIP